MVRLSCVGLFPLVSFKEVKSKSSLILRLGEDSSEWWVLGYSREANLEAR